MLAIAVGLLSTALAPAYPVVLAVGIVGGLGDALVFALPFAIAATRFHGEARRRAIGWTSGSLSLAPIIGVPLLAALGGVTNWRVALGGFLLGLGGYATLGAGLPCFALLAAVIAWWPAKS